MTIAQLQKLLIEHFPYEPTAGQTSLIKMIAEFMLDREERNLLVIKGYAGTGKTSIVKAIVDVLDKYKHGYVLLAPTGRSAKVLANYSKRSAFTIHKKIYRLTTNADGMVNMALLPNPHKNTLFIVDEASMISNSTIGQEGSMFAGKPLLDDLIDYVYSGSNCQLILIGDTAQLPPVGMDISPALNLNYLTHTYQTKIRAFELTEVVRQLAGSGILHNATLIRKLLTSNKESFTPKLHLEGFADIVKLNGEDIEDAINSAYSIYGKEDTIVVCRSNKRANIYNHQIRMKILGREEEISSNDLLMAVKNNYFWLPETSKAGFIANGEMMKVQRVKKMQELYDFHFTDATVNLIDYPDEPSLDILLLTDTISSESPALSFTENKRLYDNVSEDYKDIVGKGKRLQKVKEDRYFNALQVKFAYALTCHKSQGGQWKAVFIEQGYLKDNIIDREYLRWLYTAITRATEKVYLVNFNEMFFD